MIDIENIVEEARKAAVKLFKEDRYQEADIVLRQLIMVKADDVLALQLLALVKQKENKYTEAIALFKEALTIDPNNAENINNLAVVYSAIGQYTNAIEEMKKAIELEPNRALFHNNICTHYRQAKQLEKSLEHGFKALKLSPKESEIFSNIGSTYGQLLDVEKSIEYLKKAIDLKPDCLAPKVDLAFSYLVLGDWERGLPLYETRLKYFKQIQQFNERYDLSKRWDGQKSYKKLVVFCEQGYGDILNFIRFVKHLEGEIHLEVPEALIDLLRLNGYNVSTDCSKTEHDFHCSLMSLPYFLGFKCLDDVPNEPYIKAENKFDLVNQDKLKIGIVWAGSPAHANDPQRSCYLRLFEPLTKIPNTVFYSLQQDRRKRVHLPDNVEVDFMEGSEHLPITFPEIKDFSDTAAIINQLDLVITVDTSVLHLAGAMGKKTFAMIPYQCDWRWGLTGDTTNWYTNTKLFRQTNIGNDWRPVIKNIEKELKITNAR